MKTIVSLFAVLVVVLFAALSASAAPGGPENPRLFVPVIRANEVKSPDFDVDCTVIETERWSAEYRGRWTDRLTIACTGNPGHFAKKHAGDIRVTVFEDGSYGMSGCLPWGVCTPVVNRGAYLEQTGSDTIIELAYIPYEWRVTENQPGWVLGGVHEDGSFDYTGCFSWGSCNFNPNLE